MKQKVFGTNEGSEFVSGDYDEHWLDIEKGPLHSINGTENENFVVFVRLNEKRDYYIILCYVMLCYVVLCCVVLCYVMLCYVMLCYVMLCYVMLCYVMLCYVMLCYVILYYITYASMSLIFLMF